MSYYQPPNARAAAPHLNGYALAHAIIYGNALMPPAAIHVHGGSVTIQNGTQTIHVNLQAQAPGPQQMQLALPQSPAPQPRRGRSHRRGSRQASSMKPRLQEARKQIQASGPVTAAERQKYGTCGNFGPTAKLKYYERILQDRQRGCSVSGRVQEIQSDDEEQEEGYPSYQPATTAPASAPSGLTSSHAKEYADIQPTGPLPSTLSSEANLKVEQGNDHSALGTAPSRLNATAHPIFKTEANVKMEANVAAWSPAITSAPAPTYPVARALVKEEASQAAWTSTPTPAPADYGLSRRHCAVGQTSQLPTISLGHLSPAS